MTMPNSYRIEKDRERTDRRNAANSRAKITAPRSTIADPLSRPRPNDSDFAFALAAALAIHGALVVFAFFAKSPEMHRDAYQAPVSIEISDAPKPTDPPPSVVEPTPPPVEMPIPPTTAPPVLKPIAAIDTPPPDPINLEPPPTIAPPKQVRRVVGIDMESTTTAGSGPAFATGNTRMGNTSQVAQDPTTIEQATGTFSPPKRLSAPPPEYPPSLRAQKIEGDVGLQVIIDASGRVQKVTVVAPSEHDEFDRAAVAAANASTYESAKVNGVAITRAIDFTVRFRLHQ